MDDVRSLTVTYDATSGFPDTVTDPLGRVTTFDYDLAGRLLQESLPGERVVSYSYDDNSNLASLTPPGKPEHEFTYTALDQVDAYLPPPVGAGSDQTLYAYNADRQLTSVTRPDLHEMTLAYDSAGRLASVTIPRGTITLTYNVSTGNLQSVTAPDGDLIELAYDGILPSGISWQGDIQGSVGFTYDNDLRLGSVSVNTENPLTYTYDSDSLLTQAGGPRPGL